MIEIVPNCENGEIALNKSDCSFIKEGPPEVYVVTYWDKDEEPVVSVFTNKEAAESCRDYFKDKHDNCCLDQTYIYSTFDVY